MKPLLIGLSGKAGSGKSTAANYLTDHHGYHQFAFADALKDTVGTAFGFDEEQLYGDRKEVIDLRWGFSPRWCLQWLGTEVLRNKFPDIWIRRLRQDILDFLSTNGQHPIVVTDVRFKDEAEALKRLGAVLVRIERESIRTAGGDACATGIPGHVSEVELDGYDGWDYVVHNTGSQEDLLDLVGLVLFNGYEAGRAELAKAAR